MEGELPLASDQVGDKVIAVLARLRDQPAAVRRILHKIGEMEPADKEIAFKQLLILAGLRRMEQLVTEEARKMPILNDIMDHQVIDPAIRQGLQQGRREGNFAQCGAKSPSARLFAGLGGGKPGCKLRRATRRDRPPLV